MLSNGLRVSKKLRVFILLALLFVAPAATAADPSQDSSWLDSIQAWFQSLLGDSTASNAEADGVIHIPGG